MRALNYLTIHLKQNIEMILTQQIIEWGEIYSNSAIYFEERIEKYV